MEDLANIMLTTAVLMFTNIIAGTSLACLNGEFDIQVLINGIIKAITVMIIALMIVIAGSIIPDLRIVSNGTTTFTILDAVYYSAFALTSTYTVKCLKNITAILGVDTSIEFIEIDEEMDGPEEVENECFGDGDE